MDWINCSTWLLLCTCEWSSVGLLLTVHQILFSQMKWLSILFSHPQFVKLDKWKKKKDWKWVIKWVWQKQAWSWDEKVGNVVWLVKYIVIVDRMILCFCASICTLFTCFQIKLHLFLGLLQLAHGPEWKKPQLTTKNQLRCWHSSLGHTITPTLIYFFFLFFVSEGANIRMWSADISPKSRRGILRRAVFSEEQRKELEKTFRRQKYISKTDRNKLAADLSLKESQVMEYELLNFWLSYLW